MQHCFPTEPAHISTVMEAVKAHHHKTKALVYIISDSRGAGLQQISTNKAKTNPSSDHLEFQVTVRRGARLETLAKIAFTHKKNFDMQVILDGICSLTSKQGKVVSYSHSEENLFEIKGCINVLFTELQRGLLICTIPPASVIKSNEYHRAPANRLDQQRQLEKDLVDTNKFIASRDSWKSPLVQLDAASLVGSL